MAVYENGKAPKAGAPGSPLVLLEGSPVGRDLGARVNYILREHRRLRPGVIIRLTQGYRYLGDEAKDRPLGRRSPNDEHASETTTGDGNQWFQQGRADAKFTSANWPGTSEHGICADLGLGQAQGRGAADLYTNGPIDLRDELARQVGMKRTASNESWHYAIVGPSLVDLGDYQVGISITTLPTTPTASEEDEDMARFVNGHNRESTKASIYYQAKEGDYFIPIDGATFLEFNKTWKVDAKNLPDYEFAQIDLMNAAIERARSGANPGPQA
jgi:hypothetical protein